MNVQSDVIYIVMVIYSYGYIRRGFRGGGSRRAPSPVRAIINDKGGGGGLFPVDLSVQTANT